MTDASLSQSKLNDVALIGLRAAIGTIFIVHGISKFDAGFANFLQNMGLPVELQIPIALAETIPGILLIIGVLTRFSSSLISIIMMGAIFHVKGAANLTGQGGFELDLILLASSLLIIVVGPGKVSISHVAKKIPRFLH